MKEARQIIMPLFWTNMNNAHMLAVSGKAVVCVRNGHHYLARLKTARVREEVDGMKKTELLERVYVAHEKLTNALEGLTDEQATRVGLNAQWSVKDALSHITAWEIEGVRILSEISAGVWEPQKFDKQAIDEFNAHAVESRRENSMSEVRMEFDEAHREMERSIVSLLPDEVDESSPAYKFVEGTTFQHHTSHAGQIEEWKLKQG